MSDIVKAVLLWKAFPLLVITAIGVVVGIVYVVCLVLDAITKYRRRFARWRKRS
jgi:uncharacterized integral membrane protein